MHVIKDLEKENLFQRYIYRDYQHHGRIIWRFLPEEAKRFLEVQELLMQNALGLL